MAGPRETKGSDEVSCSVQFESVATFNWFFRVKCKVGSQHSSSVQQLYEAHKQ